MEQELLYEVHSLAASAKGFGWPISKPKNAISPPALGAMVHMSSVLFGDIMVPNIEYDSILLFVIVFYVRNIILLGLTTKKHYSHGGPAG